MDSSYKKLNIFETDISNRSINMSGRTPSFIVVGLVIIMFLLGLFYMSCSSKNTELRLSLEQFEERIRSLTLKNSDAEKKYENLNSHKRELEEEKSNIQRQMEKKDSEINDLNTQLNEKKTELKSLQSDKKVVDEQLKDYKSLSETIAAKNSLIEKLQQQLNEQKQSNNEELTQLKREYEVLKNNSQPTNTFVIPPQRFRPMEINNYTTKSIASLFQDPLNKLNNLTKEMKVQPIAAALDMKDKILNAVNSNTTTIINQQENLNNDKNQQQIGQNVPPPPLANNEQRQQQIDHVESAQAAPQPVANNQAAAVASVDNSQNQNQLQQSLNNSLVSNNKNNVNENDDEEELNFDNNAQENQKFPQQNNNGLNEVPSLAKTDKKNYRIQEREHFQQNKKRTRKEQQLDNGEELDANEDNVEKRQVEKINVL